VKVAIHQPDLLPYSGFWFKMATSDLFVLAEHDQFQKHGYQRRVTMREKWCSHQLVGKPALVPITEVEVQPGWQSNLSNIIRGRYTGAKFWKTRGLALLDQIEASSGHSLAEVNTSLIYLIRDHLGITTPLTTTAPPVKSGIDRLIEQCQMTGATQYLSGAGGAAYMGDTAGASFAAAGVSLVWSDHSMTTGDSILSILMDYQDPMSIVLKRSGDASAI
jgi:hypothetical protein